MTEQNQHLPDELEGPETRIPTPGNKLIKRKLGQLQNKAYFFEGQLNPLITENQKIKSQLTLLNKKVAASTDLLRGLLPIGSSQSRKLKLQLASIEQISEMIRQDWVLKDQDIARKEFAIEVLQKKIHSNREQHMAQFSNFKNQMQSILCDKQNSIKVMSNKVENAQRQLNVTIVKCKKQISDINESYRLRVQRANKLQTQFQIFRRQVHNRYRDYEKSVGRMKEEIGTNLLQFEQSKKNLREIYDKLMGQKMAEQAESFEMLLKMKEEEKDRLMFYYQEKQQEMQKYLNQKTEAVQKIESINIRLRQQIQKKEDQIYQQTQKIQDFKSQITQNQLEINTLTQTARIMQTKLQIIEKDFLQKKQAYKSQIQQITSKHQQQSLKLKQKVKKLEKTALQLDSQLQQKSQKLKITERSLVTAERRFNKKLEEEQVKWETQKLMLEQKSLTLEQSIKKKMAQIDQKMTQLTLQQESYQKKLTQQQEQHSKQTQLIRQQHEKQMKSFKQQSSEQFAWIKKQNQKILAEQRIKLNKQMQSFMVECNGKIRKSQDQFNEIKKNLQEEISLKNAQILQKSIEIENIEHKFIESQKRIEELNSQHLAQVKKIQKQSKKMMDDLQKQKQEQKKKIQNQMINQLMEFQAQMQRKSSEYETTLNKIQKQMMEQIKMLKSSSALEQMEQKYLSQMQRIKHQHETELSTIEEKQKQSQQTLVEQQKRRIQQLIEQYEEDMTKLAKKLQEDMEKLNDELIIEQNDHEITKLTRQQKILYLSKKIHQLKTDSEGKQTKILELSLEIQKYKRQQERIKQIIEEKVSQIRKQLEQEKINFNKQCQLSVQKTKMQANKKINQVERDRLQHTQTMFEKFNQLKDYHEGQLKRWVDKYNELETIFAERPSRAEDLSKIKQLIQMKGKMDMEMQNYHKKVQHANQIVKYLNLELENYKDTYDIFGNDQHSDKPMVMQISNQSPIKGIIKLRKISQRFSTESQDLYQSSGKYQTCSPKLNPLVYRKMNNQSPQIKQFKLFSNMGNNQSQTLIPPESPSDEHRFSNNRKTTDVQKRLKKERSLDKSGQIVLNAQNFLNLIRNNSKSNYNQNIKDSKSNEKRAYRRSKPRRINYVGLGSQEMYSLTRKKSIHQQQIIE